MASAAGFTDVKSTDYYAKPVEWAVGKSITNGTSTERDQLEKLLSKNATNPKEE